MRLIATDLAAERGGRLVFEGLSLSAEEGSLLWIAGPNGAGKSTLLRILAGLLEPSFGAIRLEPETDVPRTHQVHYLGHLNGLKATLTAGSNLTFWQRIGMGPPGREEEALEAVGLGHLLDTPAGFLSAGQKRRLALARLLVAERPIWLLDEPTTALDATSERAFGEILARHLGGGGIVIAASHDALPVTPTAVVTLGAAA